MSEELKFYKVVPAYVKYVANNEEPKPEGVNLWSGDKEPPAIDSEVRIKINGIGMAKVVEYAVMEGWLGVMALPLDPPAWLLKQSGNKIAPSIVFGCEISY